MSEITRTERIQFAGERVLGALKWIMLSGTATYFLTALLDLVSSIELSNTATLGIYVLINTLSFGVNQYVQGESGK